jgi:hypothetical protein
MNDDHINAFRGLIGAAVIGALLWVLIGWAGIGVFRMLKPAEIVVPAGIKARMTFHGVQVAYEDHKGRLYFVRNGERCNL